MKLFSEELFTLMDEIREELLSGHFRRSDYCAGIDDYCDILKDRIIAEDQDETSAEKIR